MRHGKAFNHLSRTSSHRKATLSNMASSLILNKRITTTVSKAKALRKYVEPLITRSRNDNTHSRRMAFSYLQDKDSVQMLFNEVAKKVGDRPGGYTRIIKLGARGGDSAEMAFIELVDYNDIMLEESQEKAKTRRGRRRRGGKKASDSPTEAATASESTSPETSEEEATSSPEASEASSAEASSATAETETSAADQTPDEQSASAVETTEASTDDASAQESEEEKPENKEDDSNEEDKPQS